MIYPLAQMMPGMEWLPVILAWILLGWIVGLLSIVLRCVRASRTGGGVLAVLVIALSVCVTGAFAQHQGRTISLRGYFVMASPAVLGAAALLIRRRPEAKGFAVQLRDDGPSKTPGG